MPDEGQNTGVIWRDIQPEDDIVGQSRVISQNLVADGQWDVYNPSGYVQVGLYGDTSGCTNFTLTHSLCQQINRMLVNKEIPQDKLDILNKYGFIVDGKFSVSPRYNYIKSGSKVGVGNFLYKPWDSARHDGMIPYEMLPFPDRQRDPAFTMEMFADPTSITPVMEEAAQAFLQVFTVQYETVATDIPTQKECLTHAPLAIITGCCKPWDGSIIPACGKNDGHAMDRNGYVDGVDLKTFDSYPPFQKRFAWDYPTKFAIKGVVIIKDIRWTHKFSFSLQLDDKGDEVKALQIALFLDGVLDDGEWHTQEAVQKWGGYFGENTVRAVKRFQRKYGIIETGRVGNLTNNQLNNLFN